MIAKIQKWGNSQGLRIPKTLLDATGLHENDSVLLVQTEDGIQIKRATPVKHKTLEERLAAFYGKPVEEITRIEGDQEYDWGRSQGAEAW